MVEIDALIAINIYIIALDAKFDQDEVFLKEVLEKHPTQKFMADISTVEEGLKNNVSNDF